MESKITSDLVEQGDGKGICLRQRHTHAFQLYDKHLLAFIV